MFYRVDYFLAVMLVGFVLGALFSRHIAQIGPSRIARSYLTVVVILLTLRCAIFVASLIWHQHFWSISGGLISDISNFLFGALFGLSARRQDRRELLLDSSVYLALCLSIGIAFSIAGIAKIFYMKSMIEFFTQSGYSIVFLKCIIIAEAIGGIGFLLPWAMLPTLIGFTIDMFGAVYTHIHNDDPLNDSTGAIGMLIHLGVIAVIWTLRKRIAQAPASLRASFSKILTVALACIVVAVAGSALLRHPMPSTPPSASNPAPRSK